MNERILEAISKLKKAQDELEVKLKSMEQNIDEKGSLNMQKALFTVADDLARYTIKDGNWYYNGKDTGIQAEAHDGEDGKQGPQGIPGKPGRDGKDGKPGKEGKPGKDGKPGRDGKNGKDGKNGLPGRDGKDGVIPELKIGKVEVSPEYGGAMAKLRPGKDNIMYLDLTLPRGPQGFTGFDGKDAKINGENTIEIKAGTNISIDQQGSTLTINSTGGSGGSSDYSDLTNKPKINNVELNENKSLNDLGIQPAGNYALESDMTEAQNDIENLQTENERLKATLPTTGEGQDITLDKTAEMEFVKPPLPRGNTKQDTTTGKNLLPPLDSGSLNGLTFTTNSNGITTISGTTTNVTNYFKNVNKILPAGTYTLSINLSYTPPASSSQLILQDINNVRLATINLWKITSKTFTLSADTEIKNYYLFSNSGIQHNGTISIQLEKGSTATSYEPYTNGPSPNPSYPQEVEVVTGNVEVTISNENNTESKTLPVSLGNIELCKIGDYQDYLYKNNGKWYKYNAINKLVLNGSENWSAHGSIASWFFWDGITNGFTNNTISGYALSNYFTQKPYTTVTSLKNGEFAYGQVAGETRKRFVIKDTDYTKVADFKSWLSTHNTIVYYVLATPTDTEITDATLISQLEEISKTLSYQGQTNITSNTIALFNVEAYQSTKLILEDISNELDTKVSNTDYATSSVGGVLKVSNGDHGMTVDEGVLKGTVRTLAQYNNMSSKGIVCKGTLENVITGKGLDLKQLSTFDSTKTQVLKNINGTLTWVDE